MLGHEGRRRRELGEVFAHFLRQAAHAYAGEVVDREPGIARVVGRENAFEVFPEIIVLEPFLQLGHSESFGEVLEEDLDEDAAAGSSFFLV